MENPETTLLMNSGQSIASDNSDTPDVVGKIIVENEWGNWSLAAIVRKLKLDNLRVARHIDEEWGGAINAAGRYFITEQNNLRFSLTYGTAVGRYFSSNAFNDAVVDKAGKLHSTKIVGGYLAYQHWWTEKLRSLFVIGAGTADQHLSAALTKATKHYASSHINLRWSPSVQSIIGIEWIHAYRKLENSHSGKLNRIQLTFDYKF